MRVSPTLVFSSVLALFACTGGEEKKVELPPFVTGAPAAAHLTRLTADQYRASIRDVLGDDLALPATLEPDPVSGGLISVGASEATISAWGVEQYESGAYAIAAQVMAPERRDRTVTCTPSDTCRTSFIHDIGLKLWRRPLSEEEAASLTATATTADATLDDFYAGLEYALAAMLISPNFLFRAELGEGGAFTADEMASRLSYFLWNTTPDDTLLAAAASGELATEDGIAVQARRMIDNPRSRNGVRSFFSDLFELYELEHLVKDPTLFVHYSTDVGGFAREETLRMIEDVVFERDADYREIFVTQQTFVNRHLAAIYSVPATSRDGFGRVTLPASGGRRGLLGQVSFLALQSHPAASSAVLRGHFIRKVLLCQDIPPPPVDVNTALPEPSATARTLRERNAVHLSDATCAGCHSLMDPIGLGFENFDGMGRFRETDNDAAIDASGQLDGTPFNNPWELAQVLHDHPNISSCLTRSMWRYATSHVENAGEPELLRVLVERFEKSGFSVKSLLFDIVTSPGFRIVKEAE